MSDTLNQIPATPTDPAPASVPTAPTVPAPLTDLDEFCRHFSMTERRVALLDAFHFEMRRQKRLTDTEAG